MAELTDRFYHRPGTVRSPIVPYAPTQPAPLPAAYLRAVDDYLAKVEAEAWAPGEVPPTVLG
jgi:hypothetical protein